MLPSFRIELHGSIAPLLMKNGRLVDKLDPATRAMTDAQRAKPAAKRTDADLEELAHLEWLGSMYYDPEFGPYIPGDNIFSVLHQTARRSRKGQDAIRGIRITTDVNPLAYPGPRDPDKMWADPNFHLTRVVKNPGQQTRVTKTWPRFHKWKVDAKGEYDPSVINFKLIAQLLEEAGRMTGLGDLRPRYGKFDAIIEELG